MQTNKTLTGYPSIDKPWMKYYSEIIPLRAEAKKYHRIIDKLKDVWSDPEDVMINYYDTEIKAGEFFDRVDEVAKSLVALGVKKGNSIVASLESVPEYIELLLACEKIGCCIKNFLGSEDEIIYLINSDNTATHYFAPDYLCTAVAERIYSETAVKHIVTIDPLFSVQNKENLRSNIAEVIASRYSEDKTTDKRNITWEKFLENGKQINNFEENTDHSIRLFSAFTSGSTGEPKELLHSSESVLGMVDQLSLFPCLKEPRDLWLDAVIPPIVVSCIVAGMCYPLADGKRLALDPYCKLEDIDIEMMYYQPSDWALVPMLLEALLESQRIPKDYDMSYFKMLGFGAEPANRKTVEKALAFLHDHNCHAPLSAGYGQSESGSGVTIAFNADMLLSGSSGIPHIDTTISIFEPHTTQELKYREIGEICKTGPGIMLGYADQKQTEEVLKIHPDGKLWLHTGDTGYMTEDGQLFVLGRGGMKVFPDKVVFPLEIENKLSLADGVKDAVIVAGNDPENAGFEAPYLFIVPEKDISQESVLANVRAFIDAELLPEQKPKDIFLIDKKPFSKFKVDRRTLQKQYHLK